MKKLQDGIAAREDVIVGELLKNGGEVIIDWLLEILQEVWRTKRVPSEWKKAILVPVHKKKDPHISVHPSSLLYLTSQIGEGVYFLKCP